MPGGASSADALVRAVACEGGGRGIRGNAIEMVSFVFLSVSRCWSVYGWLTVLQGGVDASRKSAPFGRLTTEYVHHCSLFLLGWQNVWLIV